ncbi:hypothetical protein V5G24_23390 [Xanthobacter sp. VTT E-85241]|uniref:hypothetical protein n=1 Tax=Roseixanthobacter finlandensis TaxID=3119922 RepID=UPI003729841B
MRLLTVNVLLGRTWARDRVADSDIVPIDDRVCQERRPFIAVYTDDAQHDVAGRNILTAPGTVALTIEIGATALVRVDLEDGAGEHEEVMPATDGAVEFLIDMIERQIFEALTSAAPAADLWRTFAGRVGKRSSVRGAFFREGTRGAARQIIIDATPPADPVPGAALGPAWVGLLAWLDGAADPHLAKMGAGIRAALEGDASPPHWLLEQASLGLTREEARALHITPPAPAEATSPDVSPVAPAPAAQPVPPVAFEGGDVRL